MKATRFTITILVMIFSAAMLWSCNKDGAKSKSPPSTDTTTPAAPGQEPAAKETPPAEKTPPAKESDDTANMAQLRERCPMVVQGTDAAVSDIEGGVALTFTTREGNVDDLRTRVRHLAHMYEMHRGHGAMMWHHMGGRGMGRGQMAGRGPMPAATATVTDIDKGARLELRPTDASQLVVLREHVREHQQRMHGGECWMLQQPSKDEQE